MSSMFKQEGLETATSLGVACIILYYLNRQLSKRQLVNLPPGPPADPIIGHARMIPAKGQDVFFYELGKLYGDVVQLRVLDRSMIILNSVEAAEDLLDARSYNYSDRPDLPVYDLLGIGDALGFAKYGKDFRVQRRMVQQYFSNSKRPEHRPVQTREARILALNILSVTQDWYKHLIRFSTAVVVEISYGHQIISNDDPYFEIAEECGKIAADSGPPGATPVDLFPILRHFPSWFPGTYYANFARKSFPAFQRLREYPFSQVTEKMNNGVALPSFLLTQLEALRSKGDFDAASIRLLQLASMHLYIAGTDTTSSLLAFFVLAMVLHPEHQAKAQEEIETIIGHDRLPDFHDRKSLPYLECILQETLRWTPQVNGG
ncbi:hypothetical protein H0H92_006045 [Tricholoma furcatifolium]|nr:hypothetical protein H0H92_006045 [Tricholoma furcatifolium]